jgi:hypothetical protein
VYWYREYNLSRRDSHYPARHPTTQSKFPFSELLR